jgi:LmbE family N-acetylglucosaminyl deacetylase
VERLGRHTRASGRRRLTVLPLTIAEEAGTPLRVLALGAHSDDIEIGCGGTLLRLLAERTAVEVHWVVLSGENGRADEALRSADAFLRHATGKTVAVHDFRNAFFRYGPEVKEYFEELKGQVSPDVVFTHTRGDLHQDHRLVCELTWNTFRDHLILEYEVPKYDGDLGRPNLFVPLDEATAREKAAAILEGFPSQRDKRWFTEELFMGLTRLRGMECNSESGYAEAFYCRKAVLIP